MNARYISAGPYTGAYKDTAKAIKKGNKDSILLGATLLATFIPKGSIVVPMPSHTGEPTYTKQMCEIIAQNFKMQCRDCLRSAEHPSLCQLKNQEFIEGKPKGSLLPRKEDLKMCLTGELPGDQTIFIIDNVVASGVTAAAAAEAVGKNAVVVVVADDETFPKIAPLKKLDREQFKKRK